MGDSTPPQLKRGIFGFTRDSVRRMLADREGMFARAQQRLKETQARVAQLELQVRTLEGHIAQRNAEVESAAARIAHLESQLEDADERLKDREALALELAAAREQLEAHVELERELDEARRQLKELEGIRRELTSARELLREQDDLQQQLDRRSEQVLLAESRVANLEAQLAGVRAGLEQRAREAEARARALDAELAEARDQLRAGAEAPSGPAVGPDFSDILETAANRIIELVGTTHRAQLEQMDRLRDQVREETERLATWRRQLAPLVGSIQSTVDRARARVEDVPERIRDALDPLGEAIDSVNEQLLRLVEEAAETESEDDQPDPEEVSVDDSGGADPDAASTPAPIHPLRSSDASPPTRDNWPN